MTDEEGWFAGLEAGDDEPAIAAIQGGNCEDPADWPEDAIKHGYVDSRDQYYDRLQELTVAAAREEITAVERADDAQLVHLVRAMDDCDRMANELAERVSEWASSLLNTTGSGLAYVRTVSAHEPESTVERQLVETAQESVRLSERADELRGRIERQAPDVAPNLSALGGPVLTARLIALAGGLEALAKLPSSTVQVLGAEDALFAHLRGNASPPKHGVIFTHEYVSGTDPENRGSAARALAGKLTIAGRIDHYAGDRRPELEAELDERIAQIRGEKE